MIVIEHLALLSTYFTDCYAIRFFCRQATSSATDVSTLQTEASKSRVSFSRKNTVQEKKGNHKRWKEKKRRERFLAKQGERKIETVLEGEKGGTPKSDYKLFPHVRDIMPWELSLPKIDGKPSRKIVGEGTFGTVELRFYKSMPVAVKHFNSDKPEKRGDAYIEAHYLGLATRYTQHPSIPFLVGICSTKNMRALITAFIGKNLEPISFSTAMSEMMFDDYIWWVSRVKEVASAVKFIHTRNVLHNDIKSNNVMLDYSNGTWRSVLIDFSQACEKSQASQLKKSVILDLEQRCRLQNKYPFLAREVLFGIEPFSVESDIYSLGYMIHNLNIRHQKLADLANACLEIKDRRPSIEIVLMRLGALLSLM